MTAENTLSQTDITNLKLTGVSVDVAPNASIYWEDGEQAYATAKAVPADQIAAARRTQDYKDFVRNALGAKIKAGVEQRMAGQLVGTRPVRLDIVVTSFRIPSVASRIIIGGDPQMIASANLVDARTGAVILAAPELESFIVTPSGVTGVLVQAAVDGASSAPPFADRLIAGYGDNYRKWLTHGA